MRSRVKLHGAVLLGAVLIAPISVHAQQAPPKGQEAGKAPPDAAKLAEAKERFKTGLQLYDDGAYDAARVQFERAYALAPSYRLLYNIGLVYKQLNDFVGALDALERYLSEGGAEVPADKKEESQKLIEQLKRIIAKATVTANVDGVEISVDDAVVGTSPLSAPLLLNPGRRKIGGKLAGRLPDAKVVTVAAADVIEVKLELPEPPTTVVKTGTDWRPVVGWTVTGAFAVGATVTGLLALGAQNDLDALKDFRNEGNIKPDLRGELDAQESKTKDLALASTILTVGAVVAAGVSVYLTWFLKPKESAPAESAPAPASAFRMNVVPGGVVGRF